MKRAIKIYLEKPELAGVVLLIVLIAFFEVRSAGVFLSFQNIRGVLGLLAGGRSGDHRLRHADDLRRIRSLGRLRFRDHADEHRAHAQRRSSILGGVRRRRAHVRLHRLRQRLHHAQIRHSELHRDARHALYSPFADCCDVGRISAPAGGGQDPDGAVHRVYRRRPLPHVLHLVRRPRCGCLYGHVCNQFWQLDQGDRRVS